MAAEGKKVRTGGNFHGKGFKFDETEANLAHEKKKFEKAALGLDDSDDEDIESDITQQIESLLNTKRTVKEVKVCYNFFSMYMTSRTNETCMTKRVRVDADVPSKDGGKLSFCWMNGINSALSKIRLNVKTTRVCAENRKEQRHC